MGFEQHDGAEMKKKKCLGWTVLLSPLSCEKSNPRWFQFSMGNHYSIHQKFWSWSISPQSNEYNYLHEEKWTYLVPLF